MEEYLFFVRSNVANVENVLDFIFARLNCAIISDSCDCVGTQIHFLVENGFTEIMKKDFVSFNVRLFFSIAIFLLISCINSILITFLNHRTIYFVTCVQY